MVTTRTKKISGRAVIKNPARDITTLSDATIKLSTPVVQELFCTPVPDGSDFDYAIEDIGQQVEIRKRPKPGTQDNIYGYEKTTGLKYITKCIVTPITERDAKLIEAGYAKIGDFELTFKSDESINVHDIVYDPIRNITLDLTSWHNLAVIRHTKLFKTFIGVVQTR